MEPTAERRDFDVLRDRLLVFAREMLRQQGSVYPFGAVTKSDGRMTVVAGSGGAAETSEQELMGRVVAGMRDQALAGEIRAAGICYAIHVATDDGDSTDAIAVSLEDVLGDSELILMPYTRGRLTGLRFDDFSVSAGEPRVFVPA